MNKKTFSQVIKEQGKNFIIAILVITLVGVAVVWPTATSVLTGIEARTLQSNGKNIEMTLRLLALEYQGIGKSITDNSSKSGLSEMVEEEIRSLTGVEGEMYILSWRQSDRQLLHMIYEENGLAVNIEYQGNGEYSWEVFSVEKVL